MLLVQHDELTIPQQQRYLVSVELGRVERHVKALVRLAQLQQHNKENLDRYLRALDHLILAEQEIDQIIDDIKTALAEHHVKVRLSGTGKGKGKQAMSPFSDEEDDIDDLEDRDLPKNPAGEEHSIKRRALQQ
ncbi:hypothetical protein M405DRAFT_877600 [Rhizopogon salebrosus TDB-379]|nr:hypothetical protein M405DRAFT_877600 [Rhizopogon salebrosus TDB-379]